MGSEGIFYLTAEVSFVFFKFITAVLVCKTAEAVEQRAMILSIANFADVLLSTVNRSGRRRRPYRKYDAILTVFGEPNASSRL